MFNSRAEFSRVGRYLGGGVINTVLGFATVFGLTALGISPYVANCSGYLVGLLSGFALNRRYVFGAQDSPARGLFRYAIAFGICFLGNLIVLNVALVNGLSPLLAQVIATATYAVAMYAGCRAFVFR